MKPAPAAIIAEAPLSHKEQQLHETAERAVEQAIRGFWDEGKGLGAILAAKTYRVGPRGKAQTWEAYLERRWDGRSPERARQVIAAALVMDVLNAARKATKCRLLPANEGQARFLVGLSAEQQVTAWLAAVDLAGGERPTGALVAQAVEQLTGRPVGAAPGEVSTLTARQVLEGTMLPEDQHQLLERTEEEATGGEAPPKRERSDDRPEQQFARTIEKAQKLTDRCEVDRDMIHGLLNLALKVLAGGTLPAELARAVGRAA
jgi:hypothetical protein